MSPLELAAYVKRGKNRQKVFLALTKPSMPSDLARTIFGSATNTNFNVVSRALAELADKDLVRIINPKERTGRLYERTKQGVEAAKELNKLIA